MDPLLPPHADYFTGALWQLHLLQPATGSTSLLAVGASTNAQVLLAGSAGHSDACAACLKGRDHPTDCEACNLFFDLDSSGCHR